MDKIEELLTKGVDKIYPSKEELEKVLRSGRKLKLYQGFDPTGDKLHIGHMVGLRKLRQWQDLGHHVIFLIGDGTGQAGDPKKTSREKVFTRDELKKNAVDYVRQAGKIVRFEGENPVEVLFNGDWLNKLNLVDLLNIAGHFSLQQLSERDLFQERIKNNEPVNLREFLYPLLQGYDSVAMNVDLEVGGSDQTFNMLCGRTLLKSIKNKEKFVMTTPLLTDANGVKIGKSEGNAIAITDEPEMLFGKIMKLPDEVIKTGFEYLTDIKTDDINATDKDIAKDPMKYKKRLAFEIITQLNSQNEAEKAQLNFESIIQDKETPKDMPIIEYPEEKIINIIDLLTTFSLAKSRSAAKQLITQNGVSINGETIHGYEIKIKNNDILKVGRSFRRIKVKVKIK